MCLLYTFRKHGIPTSNIRVLELATPEHVRQSGLTCQCGCVFTSHYRLTVQACQKSKHNVKKYYFDFCNTVIEKEIKTYIS